MHKMTRIVQTFLSVSLVIFLVGCSSKYRKLQKSTDVKEKMNGAFAYYDEGKYYKAATLFEEIAPLIRGAEEAEDILYKTAYCYYNQKQYIVAAHYFQRFYETYNRSPLAEDALYKRAFSKYLQSPRQSLDQSSTREAVEAMQNYLNYYPKSENKDEANRIIRLLEEKLANKAFNIAKQYYKVSRYKPAVSSLDNFRKDFPDSKFNEEANFLKIKAQFKYADLSINSKQKERFGELTEFYEEFVDKYPKSEFIEDAQKMYALSLEKLDELTDSKALSKTNK